MTHSIHLRPRREADRPFLAALYASTREMELSIVPWSEEQKKKFLDWQFEAQTSHYDENYSEADFLIVEQEGQPIGRIYVDLSRSRSSTSRCYRSFAAQVWGHSCCAM